MFPVFIFTWPWLAGLPARPSAFSSKGPLRSTDEGGGSVCDTEVLSSDCGVGVIVAAGIGAEGSGAGASLVAGAVMAGEGEGTG